MEAVFGVVRNENPFKKKYSRSFFFSCCKNLRILVVLHAGSLYEFLGKSIVPSLFPHFSLTFPSTRPQGFVWVWSRLLQYGFVWVWGRLLQHGFAWVWGRLLQYGFVWAWGRPAVCTVPREAFL